MPELMTENELITFLRIPEISNAKNLSHVIENLKRMHDLPCVHICRKPLYPLKILRESKCTRRGDQRCRELHTL